jgi:hypothetical protein
MSKILAVMIAGLFAVGAYAQPKPAEVDATGKGKSVDKAEMKKEAKPAGKVQESKDDTTKVSEGSKTGTDVNKAADAGEARQKTRDARRPAKTGGKKPVPVPGGTPQ